MRTFSRSRVTAARAAIDDDPRAEDTAAGVKSGISALDKAGNGVQIFDPSSSVLRVLDSGEAVYSGLTWRKDFADLAVVDIFLVLPKI